MTTFSVFQLSDGILTGAQFSGPEDSSWIEANTPAGCGVVVGSHLHMKVRVDLGTHGLVSRFPLAPADTDSVSWAWDADLGYVGRPSLGLQKEAAIATVQAEIERLEASCARALREVALALAFHQTPPAASSARVMAVETTCGELRAVMQTMRLADSATALSAILGRFQAAASPSA